jgi:hypothetical protein
MNIKRTASAGLVTGLILNGTNGIARAILQNPATSSALLMPVYYVFTNFIFGLLVMVAYAAMRPKIGDAPKMALYPAVCLWLVVQLTEFAHVIYGDESFEIFVVMAAVWLIGIVLGGIVGARLFDGLRDRRTIAGNL